MAGMRRTSTRLTVVRALTVMAVGLSLGGCGGDEDPADATDAPTAGASVAPSGVDDGGAVSSTAAATDDAGDGSASGSGDGSVAAADDDFAIPAPDGVLLDALVDAGLDMSGQRQLYYAADDFDRVVAFYDDWTSQGGEWSRGEAEGSVVYQRLDGDGIQQISITPDQDPGAQLEGPATFVLLISSE